MAITERGRWASSSLDERGGLVKGNLTETGQEVVGNNSVASYSLNFAGSAGSPQIVSIPNNTNLNLGGTSTFTIQTTVLFSNPIPSRWVSLMGKEIYSSNSGWFLYYNGGTISFSVGSSTALAYSFAFNTGQWYQIMIEQDDTFLALYIDGVLKATTSIRAFTDNTNNLLLGARHANDGTSSTDYHFGKMKYASISTNGILRGEWKFTEGSGTTLSDSSGNGNVGTITGATWVQENATPNPVSSGTISFGGISSVNSLGINTTKGIASIASMTSVNATADSINPGTGGTNPVKLTEKGIPVSGILDISGRRIFTKFSEQGQYVIDSTVASTNIVTIGAISSINTNGINIQKGTITIAGTSAVASTGIDIQKGTITIAGTGTVTTTGIDIQKGTITIAGTSTVTPTGINIQKGSITINAISSVFANTGILITDSFNRSDNTTLGSTDTGQVWNTSGAAWGIYQNTAYVYGNANPVAAYVESNTSDGTIQVTTTVLNDTFAFMFRYKQADNSFILLHTNPIRLQTWYGGSYTDISPTFGTGISGDTYKVILNGSSISVYQNGIFLTTITSTFNQTETKHGLSNWRGGSSADGQWDNFSISSSTQVSSNSVTGTVAIAGTSTVTPKGGYSLLGTASIAGTSTITATGIDITPSTITIAGTSTITATGIDITPSTITIAGTSTVTPKGGYSLLGTSSIAGTSTVAATGINIQKGVISTAGTSAVTTTVINIQKGSTVIGAIGNVVAVPYGLLVSDSFNKIDSSTSLGVAETGQAWVNVIGMMGIYSNQAYFPASVDDAFSLIDAGQADVDINITIVQDPGNIAGIYFRSIDSNNWIRAVKVNNQLYLQKNVAGTITTLQSPGGFSWNANDNLRVTAQGSSITIYFNGVSKITATETFNQTVTKHGIGVQYHGDSTFLDNFSIYQMQAINQVYSGTLAISAQSSGTINGINIQKTTVAIAGTSTVTTAGIDITPNTISIAGTSNNTIIPGIITSAGSSLISATSSITVNGTIAGSNSVFISSSSSINTTGINIQKSTVSITSTSTITPNGGYSLLGTVSVQSSGSITVNAIDITPSTISIAGTSAVTPKGGYSLLGTVSIAGTSTVAATGIDITPSTISIAGTSTVAATGIDITPSTVTIASTSTVTPKGGYSLPGTVSIAGVGSNTVTATLILSGNVAITSSAITSVTINGGVIAATSLNSNALSLVTATSLPIRFGIASSASQSIILVSVGGVTLGMASFGGTSTVTINGSLIASNSISLIGQSTVIPVGISITKGNASSSALSTVLATGIGITQGSSAITAIGNVSPIGYAITLGAGSPTGSSLTTINGTVVTYGVASSNGLGAVLASASTGSQVLGSATIQGLGSTNQSGKLILGGVASTAGTSNLNSDSAIIKYAGLNIGGVSSISISTLGITFAQALISSNSSVGIDGIKVLIGGANPAGISTAGVIAIKTLLNTLLINGQSGITPNARMVSYGIANTSGIGSTQFNGSTIYLLDIDLISNSSVKAIIGEILIGQVQLQGGRILNIYISGSRNLNENIRGSVETDTSMKGAIT